jgi:uncharacterized protein
MRWQKRVVRAVNTTRNAVLGEQIRVADTGLTRIVGLLGERNLPAGDGLLITGSQGVHTVGMMFPIDVVVLDGDWTVIAVRPRLGPFRFTPIFFKAAFVLELPPGVIEATGTLAGDRFDFVGS